MRAVLLGLLLWLAWGLAFLLPSVDRVRVTVGEASQHDIRAPQQVTFISQVETERARQEAALLVADVYVGPDLELASSQLGLLRELVGRITVIRNDLGLTNLERQSSVSELVMADLTEGEAILLLALPDSSWEMVTRESERVLGLVMRDEIRAADVARARREVHRLMIGPLNAQEREVVGALVHDLIVANTFVDTARTQESRAEAQAAVAPVIRTVRSGESIVRRGEIVSPVALERLEILGLVGGGPDWQQVGSELLFSFLVVGVLALYVTRVDPLLMSRPRRQLLLVMTLVITGVSARILLPGRILLPYLFPGAAAAMLIVLFMNIRYGTAIAFIVALMVGHSANGSLELTFYILLGSLVGALVLMRSEQLGSFVPATGYMAAANIVSLLAFRIGNGNYDLLGLIQLAGAGVANAVLSSSLCFVAYAFTSRFFGITTALQLMELARPSHPLFRQLLIKSPGTYHHSILIGNMAERAAEVIGADVLLTRVGSYYHDIGKTLRPHFFSENQADGQNPHDRLDPQTSAEIVIDHVAAGLELARRYRLPDKVQAFIAEHHGTTLASYFYRKASQQAGDHEVDEAAFRYPGPRPQSRETAILMLADAVEAWVRADHPATEPEMERVIRQVLNDRLISGQLAETELTLKDLDNIRQAFASVLKGLYHPRIQYPEPVSQRGGRSA